MSIKAVLFDQQQSLVIYTSQEDAQLHKVHPAKKEGGPAEYLWLKDVQ